MVPKIPGMSAVGIRCTENGPHLGVKVEKCKYKCEFSCEKLYFFLEASPFFIQLKLNASLSAMEAILDYASSLFTEKEYI